MSYEIRPASPEDESGILRLFPRLADFDFPPHRTSEGLWRGDEKTFRRWLAGREEQCLVLVAAPPDRQILGMAMIRLLPDPLDGSPSAHLETLVVAAEAEGLGVGSALLESAEDHARGNGAETLSLHVFETNQRARRLYEKRGFSVEWLRYRKTLNHSR